MAKLDSELAICRAEVARSPDHNLSFPSRKRMLRAIEDAVSGDTVKAHRCRTRIAIAVATKVLPFWERHYDDAPHPQRMIAGAQAMLAGTMDKNALSKDSSDFYAGLQNTVEPDKLELRYAGAAASWAAEVAANDEILYPRYPDDTVESVNDPDDPDFFDCAFWGAAAYADVPGGAKDDASLRLEFWNWYLDQAIPEALEETRRE